MKSSTHLSPWRKEFPLFSQKNTPIYLDTAATAQKSARTINAMMQFYAETNANIHRGLYPLSQHATEQYEHARSIIAKFINAPSSEIIFTKNATEAINIVAHGIGPLMGGRKEILLSEMEHHANLVPWQQAAIKHGLTLKFIKITPEFTLDYEDARKKITKSTGLVALAHVSNALGTVNDVRKIASLARSAGSLLLIDAAQSAAHIPIDVKELGCDFLAFSGHKVYGPTGIGVLWGKKNLLDNVEPLLTGGDMIKTVSYAESTWADVPSKFEAGTPPIAEAIGLGIAVEQLSSWGRKKLMDYERGLLSYAFTALGNVPGLEFVCAPLGHNGGIVAFNLKGIHPHDVASILGDGRVCIRGGHHCAMPLMERLGLPGTCRISLSFYNTRADIDECVKALRMVVEIFRGGKK